MNFQIEHKTKMRERAKKKSSYYNAPYMFQPGRGVAVCFKFMIYQQPPVTSNESSGPQFPQQQEKIFKII